MTTKSVFFILPGLYGGGSERVLLNFIHQLDNKLSKPTLVICRNEGPLHSELSKSIPLIRLNSTRVRFSILKLIKTLRKYKPDVVISTSHDINIPILLFKFLFKKSKIVIRIPNLVSKEIEHRDVSRFHCFLLKNVYKFCDAAICQSKEMKQDCIKTLGINEKKIIVIPNPLDTKKIDQATSNNEKSPFPVGVIPIVASGRLTVQKGFDNLLESFQSVSVSNPNFHLYILGEGGDKDRLINLGITLGIKKNITFLDFQKNPYIYYKFARTFVLSSRWEGFPNVVLECLYLNIPIVATDCIQSLESVIFEDRNGYIVSKDDYKDWGRKILKSILLTPNNNELIKKHQKETSLEPLLSKLLE